jgi:choline dehydrogenase-like flavoprotein
MKDGEHYDFVIIGTGAGGGTLAWKLAPSGKRILLLSAAHMSHARRTTGVLVR